MIYYVLTYLLTINLISAIIFYTDKVNAVKNRKRIPEKTLHLLEFSGGIFFMILLMYLIKHKNRKRSYFLISYIALTIWFISVYIYLKYKYGFHII